MNPDTMVSTAVLRQRREEERAELDRLRDVLDRQVIAYAERVLTAWERAEVDAEREYVSTGKAAYLSGWSADTLRKYASAANRGEALPPEWENLLAKWDGREWAICLASVPVKGRSVAA